MYNAILDAVTISIHALAKRATGMATAKKAEVVISIHALAKRATLKAKL